LFGKPAGGSILKNRSTFAPGMMKGQLIDVLMLVVVVSSFHSFTSSYRNIRLLLL